MKDYSKIFDHYYGLQYDNNVNAMIKVHELMEEAGIQVSASTKDKLSAYSDKRPFKVNYFISRVGKTLKWCPTNSPDKFAKMSLKPAEWWIAQLSDLKPVVELKLPDNWLDEQTRHITSIVIEAASIVLDEAVAKREEENNTTSEYVSASYAVGSGSYDVVATDPYDELPF